MGVSHIALVAKDMTATHAFYTGPMGFELVKVEIVPKEGGFARHAFYSTGSDTDQLIAFWDLSGDPGAPEFENDINKAMGVAAGSVHMAFQAADLDDLERKRKRLNDHGIDVLEIDHGWIQSIYVTDPDGLMVEFACMTRGISDQDKADAEELLKSPTPPPSSDVPSVKVFRSGGDVVTV